MDHNTRFNNPLIYSRIDMQRFFQGRNSCADNVVTFIFILIIACHAKTKWLAFYLTVSFPIKRVFFSKEMFQPKWPWGMQALRFQIFPVQRFCCQIPNADARNFVRPIFITVFKDFIAIAPAFLTIKMKPFQTEHVMAVRQTLFSWPWGISGLDENWVQLDNQKLNCL